MSEDDEAGRRTAARDPLLMAGLVAAAHSPDYDNLVSREIQLADLQVDSFEKQDACELSHLRWRRFNDKIGAEKQSDIAAPSDLAPSEKSEVARVQALRG